jgi:gamma-glutamyl:cysteine ligase YbdK (ATP-grasp superfamily)
MTLQPSRIHLFQGYGVELEYMIVDRTTLAVKPVADELLKYELGRYDSDFVNGMVTWSNELVLHVLELKSTKPETDLNALENSFHENILSINAILLRWNAMLMPSGAHPFMDPQRESKLWPHDNHDVYSIYDKIFDCKGHGWSNLQSTHLNLPFYDDEEFARLNAAVRLVLPILPALCGSTPILNGRFTGTFDTRLKYYKTNQVKIPSITGRVIPEAVFSKRNYLQTIYERIKADIAPYDPKQILNPIWVNSRGAIARFDRGSLEIRIMDCQECPAADMATLTAVIETVKALVNGKFLTHELQMSWKTEPLVNILDKCTEKGMDAIIDQPEYLRVFNVNEERVTARELWKGIFDNLKSSTALSNRLPVLNKILAHGNLAQRIVKALQDDYSHENLVRVYRKLTECLEKNEVFEN